MTPRVLENFSTWLADWNLVTIIGDTPPRDPNDDEDDDDAAEKRRRRDGRRRAGGHQRTRRRRIGRPIARERPAVRHVLELNRKRA